MKLVSALRLAVAGLMISAPAGELAAQALGGATGGGKELPIEVTADQTLEWLKSEQAYVARGKAAAKRGDVTVFADTLYAYYRDKPTGGTEIYRLAGDGKVRIHSPKQEAFGDKVVYDVDKQVAVLTGSNLRMITPTDVITARDSLEYYRDRQLAVARGNARAVQTRNNEKNELKGDVITGSFAEDSSGELKMQRIDAKGNVVLTTPRDVVQGNEGTYNIHENTATITGDVKITRGDNQLNGASAFVDMNTGISRLAAARSDNQGGRVRGLFVPGQGADIRASQPQAQPQQPVQPQPRAQPAPQSQPRQSTPQRQPQQPQQPQQRPR
jgi:lipopolysaccharide export system protein LptA